MGSQRTELTSTGTSSTGHRPSWRYSSGLAHVPERTELLRGSQSGAHSSCTAFAQVPRRARNAVRDVDSTLLVRVESRQALRRNFSCKPTPRSSRARAEVGSLSLVGMGRFCPFSAEESLSALWQRGRSYSQSLLVTGLFGGAN